MGISFENGNLTVTIEQEIPIFIPELDFPLPSLPTIPTIDFPQPPDFAAYALKIKADIDAQLNLQGLEPDISLSISGPTGSLNTSFPKPKLDIEKYLEKYAISIPTPNLIPSFDFPQPPDIVGELNKIKLDLEAQLNLTGLEPRVALAIGFGGGSSGSSGNNSGGGSGSSGGGGSSGSSSSGGGGGSSVPSIPSIGGSGLPSLSFTQPDFKIDIPAKLEALAPKLPGLPTLPSVDFPGLPDLSLLGGTNIDIDGIKAELNAPGIPGVNFNPAAAVVKADIYLKSRISRVKVL